MSVNKKITPFHIMFVVAIIVFIIAIYNTLTYGQVSIHPDTVVATLLARLQIEEKSLLPSSWCYSNGELWVWNQNIIDIFLTYLIKNQALARMIQSVIYYSLTCLGIVYVSRNTYKNNMWMIYVPFVLVGLQGTLSMILWEAAYINHPLFAALIIAWAVEWYEDKKIVNKKSFYFIFFSLLICCPGIREIGENLVPMAGTFLVLDFFRVIDKTKSADDKKLIVRSCVIRVLIIAGTAVASIILYKLLCIGHVTNSGARNGFQMIGALVEIKGHASTYLHNLFWLFGADLTIDTHGIIANSGWDTKTVFSAFLCLMTCFVLPLIQFLFIKRANVATKLTFTFMLLHNVIFMFMIIPFYGRLEERYCLTTVFLCMFVSFNYLANVVQRAYESTSLTKRITAWGIVLIMIVILAFDTSNVYQMTRGWKNTRALHQDVVRQMKEEGLEYGYGMWKYAYSYSIYSDFDIKMANVLYEDYGFEPFMAATSKKWFDRSDREVFLLCDESDKKVIEENHLLENVNANVLREFYLGDTGFYIYILDNNDIFTYTLE